MIIPKEIYEYIASFADDKTILNMLSVDKYFSSKEVFERIYIKKYPNFRNMWKEFISQDIDPKPFIIRTMVNAQRLLQNIYGIPYIPSKKYNCWGIFYASSKPYDRVLEIASEEGYFDIVQLMIEKGATNFEEALEIAEKGGNTEIVNYLKPLISTSKEDKNDFFI